LRWRGRADETPSLGRVGTRFATIEYLPNLGYTGDDEGESAAIERLLHVLQRRGARVVFVNILPCGGMPRFANCKEGSVGCTTREHTLKRCTRRCWRSRHATMCLH
jgi:hypothetical protein